MARTNKKRPPASKRVKQKPVAVKKKISRSQKSAEVKPLSFPIVAIGASAGGIQAFSDFLSVLSPDLGMAYVFILHLSPDHESYLPDIFSRKTKMKVITVSDGLTIKPNIVYINIPAHHTLVKDGKFRVIPDSKTKRVTHPIDYFMNSLALVYQQNSIGVVLSGNATDGTLGLKAIKEEGGITFAQDDTAHFSGMPHNSAEMGYADFVMPPGRIAKELAALVKHPYAVTPPHEFISKHESELRNILLLMHARRNVDFSHYKQTTISRRIMRRMALNRFKNLSDYLEFMKETPGEVDSLYQDLLITVTSFFRDQGLYDTLKNQILPAILKNRKPTDPIRIWIPGCATGEEAVSTAIVILEYLRDKALTIPVQIFATDLNEKSIERSRSGVYLKSALQNVSAQRLKSFFVRIKGSYQVIKSIRDMCIFAPHNLLKDPPFSKMDIISCQNVLIYIESAAQSPIMHSFHYALKSTGYLLLGKSESIGSANDLFELSGKDNKVYTKKATTKPIKFEFSQKNFMPPGYFSAEEKVGDKPDEEIDLEKETEKLLITRYAPASVLVNKDLEILRFRGSTSQYLEPATGKASLHLLKMVKEEIAFELRSLITRAKRDLRPVKKDGLYMDTRGEAKDLTIEVVPIKGSGKNLFFLVVFKEGPVLKKATQSGRSAPLSRPVKDKRLQSLEKQLEDARNSMKVMSEEFDSTREQLQSANEEVLSSNEELQSINEELETSREELQSTNEELTTINDELHTRNIELKSSSKYAEAIVETMHESLVMLTEDLRVMTANKGFYTTFKTEAGETEGNYIYELGNNQWDIPELKTMLKQVQVRSIPISNFEVTHEFPSIGKKDMLLNAQRVSLSDGKGSTILLAIQDITRRKQYEEKLRQSEEKFKLLIMNSLDIITVFDANGNISFISPAVELVLGYTQAERLGKNVLTDAIVHPDDRKVKLNMIQRAIANPDENIHAEFRLAHKNGGYRTVDAICKNQLGDERINGIIATYHDITDRKILEQQKDEFIGIASHELKTPVTSIKAYAQVLQQNFIKKKDSNAANLLYKMNTQVDRLTTLIVDLLDFTRIEGGKLKFREDNYDLRDLIREVVSDMQRATKLKIQLKPIPKTVNMIGDRYRTGQVITNLFSNAIKYSPKAKKITVSCKVTSNNATVCVQDYGIGIEKAHLLNVFNRFFRVTDPTLNTFPGLGLGLYIAAEIVHRQNGKIWVNSKPGKGSTFCFTLPRKKAVSKN